MSEKWTGDNVNIPKIIPSKIPSRSKVYFIDIPGSKQSAITLGTLTVPGGNPELYKLKVVNNRLGGGMEARLMRTLRLEKGYTLVQDLSSVKILTKHPFMPIHK